MNIKKADINTGIGLCVLSVLVWIYAEQYRGKGASEYGPHLFPQFIAICLFACAVILIINAIRNKSTVPEDQINIKGMLRVGAAIFICFIYIVIMQLIGFLVATIIFLFVMMSFVHQKKLTTRIIVSFVVAGSVFLIFSYFLKIPLPEADFTFRY